VERKSRSGAPSWDKKTSSELKKISSRSTGKSAGNPAAEMGELRKMDL
jgi:hypothetical protein